MDDDLSYLGSQDPRWSEPCETWCCFTLSRRKPMQFTLCEWPRHLPHPYYHHWYIGTFIDRSHSCCSGPIRLWKTSCSQLSLGRWTEARIWSGNDLSLFNECMIFTNVVVASMIKHLRESPRRAKNWNIMPKTSSLASSILYTYGVDMLLFHMANCRRYFSEMEITPNGKAK